MTSKIDNNPDCATPFSPQLCRAVEEFNAGAYYGCHETLEKLWIAEKRPVRELYQGILQAAVALWQLQRGNYRSALSLLVKSAGHLQPFAPVCRQVDIQLLLQQIATLRRRLEELGPDKFQQWDRALTPRLQVRENASKEQGKP